MRVGAGLCVSRPSGTQRNDNRGLGLALPAMNRPATIGSPYGAAEGRAASAQVLTAEQKKQSFDLLMSLLRALETSDCAS